MLPAVLIANADGRYGRALRSHGRQLALVLALAGCAVSALTRKGGAAGSTPVVDDDYGWSVDVNWELDLRAACRRSLRPRRPE